VKELVVEKEPDMKGEIPSATLMLMFYTILAIQNTQFSRKPISISVNIMPNWIGHMKSIRHLLFINGQLIPPTQILMASRKNQNVLWWSSFALCV
jgi:hypothetical protein